MKIKILAAIGGAIEAFVDYVGFGNFVVGVIVLGMTVAILVPVIF